MQDGSGLKRTYEMEVSGGKGILDARTLSVGLAIVVGSE